MTGCIALIVAAGRGRRLGGPLPKQYRDLAGQPVLRHTVAAFLAHPNVTGVRVVIHPDDRPLYDAAVAELGILAPVSGGASRQESVRLGLKSLRTLSPAIVLIHDAARPFVESALIGRVIEALSHAPGALPALAVVDTLKRGADGRVTTTVPRDGLFRAQTPQGFRFSDILAAHQKAVGRDLTDDAAVAEAAGLSIALVDGAEGNLKLTTEDDLMIAETRLSPPETRVGQGFDVHAFTEGSAVTLCGITLPHTAALKGHSDADVALHALTDALLGTVGAGDIGSHFPPSDETWRDAPSDMFVRRAAELVAAAGGRILNVDVTIICEAPKVGSYRDAMRDAVAAMLALDRTRVSIKATTTEGLGFTGRGEGIAAQAVATVRLTTTAQQPPSTVNRK